ncbi:peptidoglycan-binding domain-containing protein [Enterobacter sp. Ap-1006]|uniref:peptidoglycan-binding domain-containing protein n=1 Tax=Enterobacter sp. Ap-1006 TaxID=2608345 RepID=UPI00257049ED|nr:peptidoglycan-binding domain-containing protein [Enterobacter sp. Ap-1006]
MKQLSGESWVSRFQGSSDTQTLSPIFRANVNNFLKSLEDAGVRVTISATLRPPERAYLMHWSWKLARGMVEPANIPEKSGVEIEWVHKGANGKADRNKSINAAKAMVRAYGMSNLNVAPALRSRHTEGNAIDMTLSWMGNLEIKDNKGETVIIKTMPRDGMNAQLHEVGKSFDVIKYHGGANDKPHWSTDGR